MKTVISAAVAKPKGPKYSKGKNIVEFWYPENVRSAYATSAWRDGPQFSKEKTPQQVLKLDRASDPIPHTGTVTIEFDYPLEGEVYLTFKNVKTRGDLALAIWYGYKYIYSRNTKMPSNFVVPKEPIKPETWGHSLTDLAIERVTYKPNRNVYTLNVGS